MSYWGALYSKLRPLRMSDLNKPLYFVARVTKTIFILLIKTTIALTGYNGLLIIVNCGKRQHCYHISGLRKEKS